MINNYFGQLAGTGARSALSVMLGIPEVVVGASWQGYETSQAFLESHGVKITILELEECKALII